MSAGADKITIERSQLQAALSALSRSNPDGRLGCCPCGACTWCKGRDRAIGMLSEILEPATRKAARPPGAHAFLCRWCRKPISGDAMGNPDYRCPHCGLRSVDEPVKENP